MIETHEGESTNYDYNWYCLDYDEDNEAQMNLCYPETTENDAIIKIVKAIYPYGKLQVSCSCLLRLKFQTIR